jgi:hypothetical protein
VIGLTTSCSVDVVAVMGNVFILVCNFHVSLALKVGCLSSGVGCHVALVFMFLDVGLMAIFMVLRFSPAFFSIGVYFVGSQSWRGV